MTRHQHHSVEATPLSQSLIAHMPAISEDDQQAELDDPPEVHYQTDSFTKARPALLPRRESLLTRALHSDSEHPYDDEPQIDFVRLPSRSSTCSTTYSGPSAAGFTSDEGHNSAGTRASTPCSPPYSPVNKRSIFSFFKPAANRTPAITVQAATQTTQKSNAPVSASDSSEPKVEAELGRKRCISFACGRKPASPKTASPSKSTTAAAAVDEPHAKTEPAKRPCMIKFACPSKISGRGQEAPARKPSPAPQLVSQPPSSPSGSSMRQHRGSDTTIQPDSPKSLRKSPAAEHKRKDSNGSDIVKREARKFYEFASSDGEEEVEEWTRNSTFPSRLTVSDTLKKENVIRKTCEEAEEEALADEAADEDDEDDDFAFSDDEVASEAGFQTDDEDGFADSDGEDSDSDYEWWAPRKSRSSSPYVTPTSLLPADGHEPDSDSSVGSHLRVPRHKSPMPRIRKASSSVAIRPKSPEAELPDSTDFVCGTLDEDRPLEEAFKQHIEARRAAKHKVIPQDLDPTFPTSDPDLGSSDDSDGDQDDSKAAPKAAAKPAAGAAEFQSYLPHDVSVDEDEPPRGRKPAVPVAKRSPQPSPRRLRSPAPVKRNKSPAPHRLFDHSPKKYALQQPPSRLRSPPPSRRASTTGSPNQSSGAAPFGQLPGGTIFLGQRPQLTHTSSLPRSPRPFCRGSRKSSPRPRPSAADDDDDDDGELTAGPSEKQAKLYHRGAMDIVQGLEAKRLRRRQKFYEKYCRKEKRREERREERTARRPQPGKGAERMRQVGIECANYRSCRVLSV